MGKCIGISHCTGSSATRRLLARYDVSLRAAGPGALRHYRANNLRVARN